MNENETECGKKKVLRQEKGWFLNAGIARKHGFEGREIGRFLRGALAAGKCFEGGKMRVLIPILSEQENNEAFLEQALKGAKEAIVLLVVDTNTNTQEEFGFTTAHIQKGRAVIESVKEIIGRKRKKSEEIIEWGDPKSKILNLALLRKVDKVIMKSQENNYFKNLVKSQKDEKIEVETV